MFNNYVNAWEIKGLDQMVIVNFDGSLLLQAYLGNTLIVVDNAHNLNDPDYIKETYENQNKSVYDFMGLALSQM